jgi:hypothetical protein
MGAAAAEPAGAAEVVEPAEAGPGDPQTSQ